MKSTLIGILVTACLFLGTATVLQATGRMVIWMDGIQVAGSDVDYLTAIADAR